MILFFPSLKNMKKRRPIICFLECWTLGSKLFVLCLHLLVMNKVSQLLKNMTKNLYFLCFWNVIIICIHWLKSERGVVDQKVGEDMSLDNFEMTTNISKPIMELVNREFLIFKHYQMDVKDIKCPLQWWEKHENMFPMVCFCARKSWE